VPSIVVTGRPLHNGDTFGYSGTTSESFVYEGASPSPAASTSATVTQTIAVSAPATFNGVGSLFDFHTVETDVSSLQTTTTTTDTYYAALASGTGTNLVDYGYNSTDNFGETLLVQYGATGAPSPIVIDELPQVPGASWSNTAAETLTETDPGNQSSLRTVNADGSYTDNTSYASGSLFTPPPTPLAATIVENSNGSGSYSFPLFGELPNTVVALGTPNPATEQIPINITQPGYSPINGTVGVWYGNPLVLYKESDTNNGAVNIPTACAVAPAYGTTANAVVQKIRSVDAILGTIDTLTQTTYVIPIYGAACVVLNDQILSYYDYSGQNLNLVEFSDTPLQTTTIATTLGLTSASVSGDLRTRDASQSAAIGLRIANARANFVATVERAKLAHERMLLQHLTRALTERLHR
jgi:hypothetical protein